VDPNLGRHHGNQVQLRKYISLLSVLPPRDSSLASYSRQFQLPHTTYINTAVARFLLLPPCPGSSPPPVLEAHINNGRQQGPRPRRHAMSGSVRPRKAESIVCSRLNRRAVCHEPSKQERARRDPERGRSRQRWEALV
jgi:hypothetical protein